MEKIRRVNYFLKNFPAYKSNFQNTVLADHGWERLILSGLTAILQW